MNNLGQIIERIASELRSDPDKGEVADYIPQLACIDPDQFGIAAVAPDGKTCSAGDSEVPFSIQSVSKVFMLTLALARHGESLWERVGREPSGDPFNSIVQLEHEMGVPRNPLINAGAIVVSDVLLGDGTPKETIAHVLDFIRDISGEETIDVDLEVAESERAHGSRNRALANFMKAYGNIHNDVDAVLEVYFRVCAISMTCRQMALAGRFLAWDGCIGPSGDQVASSSNARRINSLMLMCGHYDGSGEFAYRVGLPGKSGVGGGIVAVVPGKASIACWSPGLNRSGNSKLGTEALRRLAAETGWSIFAA